MENTKIIDHILPPFDEESDDVEVVLRKAFKDLELVSSSGFRATEYSSSSSSSSGSHTGTPKSFHRSQILQSSTEHKPIYM